jgi:hypothetical protein
LSLEQLHQIKTVFRIVGPYVGKTLEEFERCFKQDADNEIVVWHRITVAWQSYQEKFGGLKTLPVAEGKKILGALGQIVAGASDAKKLGIPVEIGRRLLQCYEELKKESRDCRSSM